MISVQVEEALNDEVKGLGLSVAWPNVDFTPVNEIFLRVNYLQSRPEQHAFGSDRIDAILQIDVVDMPNKGAIDAQSVANQIEALFAFGRTITVNAERIRVTKTPWASPRLIDREINRYFIPVNIQFEVIK